MSTAKNAKALRNWTSAGQREDACQSCAHVERRQSVSQRVNITTWWCPVLGAYTSALAVCDELAIRPTEAAHG